MSKIALLLPRHPDPVYVLEAVRELHRLGLTIDLVVASYPMCATAFGVVLDLALHPAPRAFGHCLAGLMQHEEFWEMSGLRAKERARAGRLRNDFANLPRPRGSSRLAGLLPGGDRVPRWRAFVEGALRQALGRLGGPVGPRESELVGRLARHYQGLQGGWPELILIGVRSDQRFTPFRFLWLRPQTLRQYGQALLRGQEGHLPPARRTNLASIPETCWCYANTVSATADAGHILLDALAGCSSPAPVQAGAASGREPWRVSAWPRLMPLAWLQAEAHFAGADRTVALTHVERHQPGESLSPERLRQLADAELDRLIQLLAGGPRDTAAEAERQWLLHDQHSASRMAGRIGAEMSEASRDLLSERRSSLVAPDSLDHPLALASGLNRQPSVAAGVVCLHVSCLNYQNGYGARTDLAPARQQLANDLSARLGDRYYPLFEDDVTPAALRAKLSEAARHAGAEGRLIVILQGHADAVPLADDMREPAFVPSAATTDTLSEAVISLARLIEWCHNNPVNKVRHVALIGDVTGGRDFAEAVWAADRQAPRPDSSRAAVVPAGGPFLATLLATFFGGRTLREAYRVAQEGAAAAGDASFWDNGMAFPPPGT